MFIFIDEKTAAQKGRVTCSRPDTCKWPHWASTANSLVPEPIV